MVSNGRRRRGVWIFGTLALLAAVSLQFYKLYVVTSTTNTDQSHDKTTSGHWRNETSTIARGPFTNTSHVAPATSPPKQSTKRPAATDTDANNTNLPHPFAGACFPNGTRGYVADPTALKRGIQTWLQQRYPNQDPINPDDYYWDILANYASQYRNDTFYYGQLQVLLQPEFVCNLAPGQAHEGDGGYRIMTEKIRVYDDDDNLAPAKNNVKILCAMYTYDKMRDLARTQALSWGRSCDGFLAFTNETMEQLGMVHLLHKDSGKESYNSMWQKVRSIWAYLYTHYLNDYDFFHLGGDDLYVIVENLRKFLDEKQQQQQQQASTKDEPLFLGAWMKHVEKEPHYVAGAPGYTLNRAALRRFVQEALPTCRANLQSSAEDRFVTRCFQDVLKIEPGDTRDFTTGEQQYHDCDPNHLYFSQAPKGRNKGSFHAVNGVAYWQTLSHPSIANKTVGPKRGLEAAAKYSVSLHNIYHPTFVARLHSLIYKATCPANSNLGRALRAQGYVKE